MVYNPKSGKFEESSLLSDPTDLTKRLLRGSLHTQLDTELALVRLMENK